MKEVIVSPGGMKKLREDVEEVRLMLKALDKTDEATLALMLNGENTTDIFSRWWTSSWSTDSQAGKNRYDTLTRWFKILQEFWAGKTYTIRFNDYRVSRSSVGTPMDDLAGKTPAICATDATTDTFDWADEDPMTWYVRGNALSLADGSMNIMAVEGVDDTFDITGNLAPVYTFRLGLFKKHWTDGTYEYKSFATVPKSSEYKPWAADVDPTTNGHRVMDWQATFGGSLTSDGKLTSGSGFQGSTWGRNSNAPATRISASTGLTKARLWDQYEGTFSDTDLEVILDLFQLRHFNLENSGIIEGCLNYGDLFYTVAIAEEGVTSVVVTPAQGANILVGSFLEIGSNPRFSGIGRGNVLSKEEITIDDTVYCRVNLDLPSAVNVTSGLKVGTLPWTPGSTEHLPGHKDGSIYSCTNGKTPARIAGVEIIDGAQVVGLDPLWRSDYDSTRSPKCVYTVYQCRDSENQAGEITDNYEESGTFGSENTGWQYVKHHEIRDDGMIVPDAVGGSSTAYLKSCFCFSNSSGDYHPERFGYVSSDSYGGLAGVQGTRSPTSALWYNRPRLSGSGKKRGTWTANSTY